MSIPTAVSMPLTDSYVAATLKSVPRGQRAEIERELRAAIADDVDGRIENGADPTEAEFAALNALGDPAGLAASYSGRALTLIGPATYTSYLSILRVVVATAIPLVFVVVLVVGLAHGQSLANAIFGALWPALTAAVYLAVLVTIAFVLIDRAATRASLATHRGRSWSPKLLAVEERPVPKSWVESVWSVIFTVILIAAVVVSRTNSPVTTPSGAPIQILAPSLWAFWLPYFLVILMLGVVLDFVRLGIGRWHPVPTAIGTVLTLAGAVPFVVLAYGSKIVNPAIWSNINAPELSEPGSWLSIVIALFVAFVALANIVEEWRKRRHRRARETFAV
jgi:hypothetical protein